MRRGSGGQLLHGCFQCGARVGLVRAEPSAQPLQPPAASSHILPTDYERALQPRLSTLALVCRYFSRGERPQVLEMSLALLPPICIRSRSLTFSLSLSLSFSLSLSQPTRTHARTHGCMYVCMYLYMYACMYMQNLHVRVCARARVCAYDVCTGPRSKAATQTCAALRPLRQRYQWEQVGGTMCISGASGACERVSL